MIKKSQKIEKTSSLSFLLGVILKPCNYIQLLHFQALYQLKQDWSSPSSPPGLKAVTGTILCPTAGDSPGYGLWWESQEHFLAVGEKHFGITVLYLFSFSLQGVLSFWLPFFSSCESGIPPKVSLLSYIKQKKRRLFSVPTKGGAAGARAMLYCWAWTWEYLYPLTSCISFPSTFPLWPLLCHIIFCCPTCHFFKAFSSFSNLLHLFQYLMWVLPTHREPWGNSSIPMKTSNLLWSGSSSIFGILLPASWRAGVLTVTSELLYGTPQSTCWISGRSILLVGGGSVRKSSWHWKNPSQNTAGV